MSQTHEKKGQLKAAALFGEPFPLLATPAERGGCSPARLLGRRVWPRLPFPSPPAPLRGSLVIRKIRNGLEPRNPI